MPSVMMLESTLCVRMDLILPNGTLWVKHSRRCSDGELGGDSGYTLLASSTPRRARRREVSHVRARGAAGERAATKTPYADAL